MIEKLLNAIKQDVNLPTKYSYIHVNLLSSYFIIIPIMNLWNEKMKIRLNIIARHLQKNTCLANCLSKQQ